MEPNRGVWGPGVSILTRPEGRVQPCTECGKDPQEEFQSSPVPKDGCNALNNPNSEPSETFQSSPVPKDGCNPEALAESRLDWAVSILTRPEGRVQLMNQRESPLPHRFQSSPVPKDGCNRCN